MSDSRSHKALWLSQSSLAVARQAADIIAGIADRPVVYLALRLRGSAGAFGAGMRRCSYARAGGRRALSCFSSADGVQPGPRCSEMESMSVPVPLDAE